MAELTAAEWRDRLLKRFVADFRERRKMLLLYESEQPVVPILDRYADAYKRILEQARTPWGRLVVDIVSERMRLTGFTANGEGDVSDELWDILRENHIESVQQAVHREALAIGTSYVSVWETDSVFSVVQESGMTATHENMPGDPNTVAAAIKVWWDSINYRMRCEVYLADEVVSYVSEDEIKDPAVWTVSGNMWDKSWLQEGEPVENPSGVVPLVPFVVRPNFLGYGRSDLAELEPTIQRIETLTANTMLSVEFGAFRQRWATGLEIPTNDEDDPIEPFKVALDRLWISEDPDTKFGSFDYTDIRPYLQAISDGIGQLSAVSRIPTLYFNQSDLSNPPSAASLEASETGLINKVKERVDRFAEAWETVAMLVLKADDPRGIKSLWTDPRTRSDAQVVDAAVKMETIGVPWEVLMGYIGFTPPEVQAMKAMRASDTFTRLLNTALPQATPVEVEAPAQAPQPQNPDTAE